LSVLTTAQFNALTMTQLNADGNSRLWHCHRRYRRADAARYLSGRAGDNHATGLNPPPR
jgi:hypothetical protein